MIIRLIASLAVAAVASGCAVTSKTFAPDGRQAFNIDCSGWAMNWSACIKKAGSICKEKGYDIYTRDAETGALITANEGTVFGGSIMNRNMLIACKPGRQEAAGTAN
jgi:hypothetical protein